MAAKALVDPSSHLPVLVGDPGLSKDVGRALLKERRDTALNPTLEVLAIDYCPWGGFDHMLPKLLKMFHCQFLPPKIRSEIGNLQASLRFCGCN